MTTSPAAGSRRPRIAPEVGETLAQLAHVTNELTAATTVDAVTKIVTQRMADAVGATIAALGLRHGPNDVRLIGVRGLDAAEAVAWQVFSLDTPTTISDVIRSGRRIVLVGAEAIAERYPNLLNAVRGERSTVTVPLRSGLRTIGAIHLSIPDAVEPDPTELEFIDVLADSCAQAFERIDAAAVAEKQTSRLTFLAEASIQLASSLDLPTTTARVTQLTVPRFADWCAIDVVRDGAEHRLAVTDPDEAMAALVAQLRSDVERRPDGTGGNVGSGTPLLVEKVDDEMLAAAARDDAHLTSWRTLGMQSILAVPLLVRGRVSGVLTWVSTDPERRYDTDDVRFAEHLARRAAAAIDNADLFEQTRAVAEQLQRAVLPRRLVGTTEWEVASRYEPSGRTEVGGDFYDAFALEDGRFVAFVGDVMGRGVDASAAMAQTRAAVRALSSVDPTPEVVLDHLDRMTAQFDTGQLVTLVYLLADAATGTVRIASAGHLPPVLVRRDGPVEQLPDTDGPPLGLVSGRRSTEVSLGTGDTLVLVTDGLVERRGEHIDTGLERLRDALAATGHLPLDAGLGEVVRLATDEASDDDVAVLALRRSGA